MNRSSIQLTVDTIIFGYQANITSILLIKRKNEPFKDHWAIPGGFVNENETLEAAAKRELREETSLYLNSLEQFHTFGNPDRDPRGHVVSVVHFGLIRCDQFTIKAGDDAQDVRWYELVNLPILAFDHRLILEKAVSFLKREIDCETKNARWIDKKAGFTQFEIESIRQSIGKGIK